MFDKLFRSRFLARLVVLQVAALTICGCGGGGTTRPQGKVSGTVKYKGQPVTTGQVNLFQKATGAAATVPLDASGKFTIETSLDTGTYQVAITPPLPKQLPPGTAQEKPAPFPLPIKYQDMGQSGLTQEVKAGDNTLNIDIPE